MKRYHDDPPTPASEAIQSWNHALVAAMRDGVQADQGVFVAPLPPLVARAGVHDFRAAHWALDADSEADARGAQEQADWCSRVYFSPNHTHRAVLFAGDLAEWEGGAALWIDGDPVPVPRASDGSSRIDDMGEWLDERCFAASLGGLHTHPLATVKLTSHGLGDVRGVWVYDAVGRTARSIVPPDDQAWRLPVAAMVQGRLAVYATPQDRLDGRAAWLERL